MNKKLKKLLVFLICVLVIALFIVAKILFISSRFGYERKVNKLKNRNAEYYEFLPDTLPFECTNWRLSHMPTIMQGDGWDYFIMNVDESYVNQVVNKYEGKTLRAFTGYTNINDSQKQAMIVTDAGKMYKKEGKYESVGETYTYTNYEYDMRSDDISEIHFYTSDDELSYKNGCIDKELYDVRTYDVDFMLKTSNIDPNNDVIIYILYDNDYWNHWRRHVIIIDKDENIVAYCIS